ncbi:hypothetical protein R70723_21110 [Paenibacillus sp. FSL R7-0273]|uniref:hypothetical protein n=1 Tax=Paenibacillus sp. FSL R7-0273 TaxID=1536772 RepID=UPI0004F7B99D|nr:hypothetical protein [Paenibacillus sp. FSL R7-0273]AIQ48128.1 hypothetical protein R70723_21110 [Paenibacillus sp. FSL R7-0273]OMF91891.1 hypothetical protein BK144_14180 [Paenibacillus sp. FSL R7-0273]
MRIKGIAITLAAVAVVLGITAIVAVIMGDSEDGAGQAAVNSAVEQTEPIRNPATTPPAESNIATGEIDTTDGQNLSVRLSAGMGTNFAVMNKKQGDVLVMKVESDEGNKLEIGILSVSSDEVYSEVIPGGTGEITITVPEDGDYRVYIKNHAAQEAHFRLILDEALTGPLV